MSGRAMAPMERGAASFAAAMAVTWCAGTAAADPSDPETGQEAPVVAPLLPGAAPEGSSEPGPASPAPPSATEANAVASEAPTVAKEPVQTATSSRQCSMGGCPKDGDRSWAEYRAVPETRWYGYQNMLVDLGGLTLAVLAADRGSENLGYLALATYLLGSPSVHWGHEQVGAGFGSLGLRVGAPAFGAGLGCAADDKSGMFGCLGGAALGGLLGGAAALVIDYAALAYEEVPDETAKRLRLTPSFALAPEAGRLMPSVGLGGAF